VSSQAAALGSLHTPSLAHCVFGAEWQVAAGALQPMSAAQAYAYAKSL